MYIINSTIDVAVPVPYKVYASTSTHLEEDYEGRRILSSLEEEVTVTDSSSRTPGARARVAQLKVEQAFFSLVHDPIGQWRSNLRPGGVQVLERPRRDKPNAASPCRDRDPTATTADRCWRYAP
ncbi:hypothetical protein EVAR_62744_1 [Eumeta japonica]|uniref:Uncharacterized protein n=1 Tax=Eumeta variegata TaxID=151549 RepID=A0A4C1Z772_EUMVA|nr:hypothetical protein EVAR_62744_1 [Eumeta japonica]